MDHRPRAEHAFTLIEVLVALAVIAIGLLAVVAVAARSGRIQAGLEDRALAGWIAENRLTQLRLSPEWPAIGDSDDDLTFADRKWHWEVTVDGTPDKDLRRVTVKVALAASPHQPYSVLVGFIGKPDEAPLGPPAAPKAAPGKPSP